MGPGEHPDVNVYCVHMCSICPTPHQPQPQPRSKSKRAPPPAPGPPNSPIPTPSNTVRRLSVAPFAFASRRRARLLAAIGAITNHRPHGLDASPPRGSSRRLFDRARSLQVTLECVEDLVRFCSTQFGGGANASANSERKTGPLCVATHTENGVDICILSAEKISEEEMIYVFSYKYMWIPYMVHTCI